MTDRPTRRLDRGRGHTYLLDGAPAPGVTTIVGNGVPKPALINWAADESAKYVLNRWDELLEMQPADRYKAVLKARFDTTRQATVRGTDVHKLAHRLAAGETVDVPEHLIGHVDAYLRFVEEWQPHELLVEAIVANRKYRYMGTLDLVCELAPEGEVWLLDWKTTGSGIYPESALQLAGYRYAEFYLGPDGQELPLPEIERTGCVWLRADGYDLIPVETDPQVYRSFLYAQQVAQFTDEPRERYVGEALTPPVKEAAA